MTEHNLKTLPTPFEDLLAGRKTFELRSEADRTFAVGDTLVLQEWVGMACAYTGREVRRVVSHILRGPRFGLLEDHVILSFENIAAEEMAHAVREAVADLEGASGQVREIRALLEEFQVRTSDPARSTVQLAREVIAQAERWRVAADEHHCGRGPDRLVPRVLTVHRVTPMNTKTQTTIVHLLSDGHACTEFIDDITIERATRGRDNYSMSSRKRRDYAAIVAVLEMPVRESGTYTVTMDGIEGASYIDGDVLFTSVEVTKT